MAIAALILGILGGLFGLLLAVFGYGIASIAGAAGVGGAAFFKLIMIVIPIAAIVGGALSIAKPLIAGVLMLVSAALVLLVFGFNGFAFLSVLLTGIGGVLALVASQNAPQRSAAS